MSFQQTSQELPSEKHNTFTFHISKICQMFFIFNLLKVWFIYLKNDSLNHYMTFVLPFDSDFHCIFSGQKKPEKTDIQGDQLHPKAQ